jgi:hypothetical protein
MFFGKVPVLQMPVDKNGSRRKCQLAKMSVGEMGFDQTTWNRTNSDQSIKEKP